jgi:spore coat polysaccharide biosynthesis predicted glycosyltransferase SpsG
VLTTGGLSKYEAAFIGRPAILLSQNLDEAKSTQSFEKAGLAMHLGFGKGVTAEMIKTAVSRVIHNPASARLMAARGRNKFDGKGASRIIKELNKELNR